MREMLRPYRVSIGLVGKHRDSRATSLRIKTVDVGTGAINTTPLAIDQYPITVMLFQLTPPSIIVPLSHDTKVWHPWLYLPDTEPLERLFAAVGPNKAINAGHFYPIEFCRMLAKIAHGFAVATGVPSGFRFLLKDIILGHDPQVFRLVGSTTSIAASEPNIAHTVILNPHRYADNDYVVVDIRLFAYLGTPTYQVVVAERRAH